MPIIANDDLNTMINTKILLESKLNKGTEIELEVLNKYTEMIERFMRQKRENYDKSNRYNKAHPEYHRMNVNLYNFKKTGNIKKVKEYEQKLEEYRRKKKENVQ